MRLIHQTCLAFVFVFFSQSLAFGQFGRFPDNGESGIPGAIPNSYVIGWSPLPGAQGYEYIISDNPQCFEGCSGDTRQQFVRDTASVEFNLQANHRYYWIIRTYFAEGDTSEWSFIYSFTTENTDYSRKMIQAAPSLVSDGVLRLRLDWAQYPEANFIDITLIGLDGRLLGNQSYRTERQLARYQTIEWPLPQLAPGTYIVRADIGEEQIQRKIRYWVKVQIQ